MSTLRTVVLVVLASAVVAGIAASPALAGPQGQLAGTRAKIAAAQHTKSSLSDQISALDGRLGALDDKLRAVKEQIAGVEQKLGVTRQKLTLLQDQLQLKKLQLQRAEERYVAEETVFQDRVVMAYKTTDLDYMDVVLSSTSFDDLITRMDSVKHYLGGDNSLVGDLETLRDQVAAEKRAVAARTTAVHKAVDDLASQSRQLAALRAEQAAQQAAAVAARRDKTGALAHVNKDLAALRRQEAQLLAESNALTGVITGSQGSGHGTGSLMWPVSGSVVSGFGYRVHPITGQYTMHTGIDIAVGYGVPIHAADSGTVIYATWMGGYGNVIIVDHGGGISTLYAHQSSLAAGNGARVSRGQVIGYVGSTGFSTGPHLHFEVRLNGNPVNPMSYLP